jgi:hypothetical protein
MFGVRRPEAELRQTWESTAAGRPREPRESPGFQTLRAVMTGARRHADITVPALVIFALPHVHDAWVKETADAATREAAGAYFAAVDALAEEQAKALEGGVPAARVIRIPGAHYVFLSNEQDVLREVRGFLGGLE